MKNIALSGIFEPDPNSINTIQGAMLRVDGEGAVIILDSCVFSNINGQVIRTESASKTIKVTNTIFTNLGALTTSNFGAGKGIDLRASSCDTLVLVNNTFTNYQDRVIRHYNFSNPLAGTGNIKYTLIDHNTFYNGMGFHGLLSLGNVGDEVIITNNLFKDAFAAGEDSTDETRSVEWANTGEKYPNGSNRMMWIFTAPNDSTVWNIKNNFYAISTEGQAFFDAHTTEPILEGPVLSWHINSKLGADSVNAFTKIADPGLVNTQDLMVNLMNFYVNPDTNVGANKTKETGSFDVTRDDMDRRPMSFWLTELDASYSTASPAYVGAEDGFPVGDLNWFPDQKAEWENPTPPLIIVDGEKDAFFAGLTGPDDGYLQLRSFAHSDNGAPTDDADLSVKLWSAWDDDWFYIYEEVTDDQVSGDAANVWEEDEIELKFDPQPTDSTVNSNWETRLTALGQSEGDAVQFDNLGPLAAENKQYFRKLTANGYVLEMGIKWAGIVNG
ncbi:MAG: sugar-binding protein, partial [Melioribacteraceae bacterium]